MEQRTYHITEVSSQKLKPINYIVEYYDKIIKGQINASKKIKQQLKKLVGYLDNPETNFIENLNFDGTKVKEYFVFDYDKANRVISFIETFCQHTKGDLKGKLIKLELWQKAIIYALYGFVSVDTGFRKYRKLHLYIARKNGKTMLAACIILYELLAGGEAGAECYSAATKRDQAKIGWNMANVMIKQNPALVNRFRLTVNGIYTKPFSDSFYQPVSKESKKLDGLHVHLSYIDELHAITDSNLIDVLWDGTKARKQPIELITSTMGETRSSTFDEIYEYDENVLDKVYEDDRLLVFCYELDNESEYKDYTCWIKANPNLGVSLSISDLHEEVKRAINNPNQLTNLLCKSFNVRQASRVAWLKFDEFNNEEVYDLEQFKDSIVLGGFDLSRTGDMTAVTTLLFDTKNKKVIAETMYWITQKYLDSATKVPLKKWVEREFIRVSGNELINYHDIADYIIGNYEKYGWKYQYINYDSYSAQYLIEELSQMGYSKDHILIPTIQGFKTLSIPMQEVEADVKEKRLCYQNNPVTKWCFSNVELEKDRNGNYMPKKGSYERKIDGVATIINAYVSYCKYKEYFIEDEYESEEEEE